MVQHADEVVDVVGPVAAGVQRLGQGEEGLRVVGEEVDVEDGLGEGEVVLLQVGVQACSWGSGGREGGSVLRCTVREEADLELGASLQTPT